MCDTRLRDLRLFYDMLGRVAKARGAPFLRDLRRADVPRDGVYFFFESGEERSDTGTGSRVVRVGTHALIAASRATLWNRLAQHRGPAKTGGGNHRGSIFRLLIGEAIQSRTSYPVHTWGIGSNAPRDVRADEAEAERAVSEYLYQMQVIVAAVPGRLDRHALEKSAIGLLSNYHKPAIDPPSQAWLGYSSLHERVRASGLWNNRDVDANFDPIAFTILERDNS